MEVDSYSLAKPVLRNVDEQLEQMAVLAVERLMGKEKLVVEQLLPVASVDQAWCPEEEGEDMVPLEEEVEVAAVAPRTYSPRIRGTRIL